MLPDLNALASSSGYGVPNGSAILDPCPPPSRLANCRYRVWFTWYIMQMYMPVQKRSLWLRVLSSTDPSTDFWLWEVEDEEFLKVFAEGLSDFYLKLPADDWASASLALETRQSSRVTTPISLAHLAPQTRIHFVAWLIIAGPLRAEEIMRNDIRKLDISIASWGKMLRLACADSHPGPCEICEVSHLLPIWVGMMLKVYSLDDLRSIPWNRECSCLEKQFTIAPADSTHRDIANGIGLPKDSAALRVLYELTVSPWPLIFWVAFREVVNDRTTQSFLDILGTSENHDVFVWDEDDDLDLYLALPRDVGGGLGLYPSEWSRSMVDIDLRTWRQIDGMTRTMDQLRRGSDDIRIRLVAVLLRYSSTLVVPLNMFSPLDIGFEELPFASIARAVATDYKAQASLADLESEQFWLSSELDSWPLQRGEDICHEVWHTSPHMSVLQRVESMYLVLTGLHQNLAMYIYSVMITVQQGSSGFREFREFQWDDEEPYFRESLKNYYADVEKLISLVKESAEHSDVNPAWNRHTISQNISKHITSDIAVVVAELILFLRDPSSY
ncbi:hypothetical protein C8F04DRAFT_1321498 [Mycena alexandri]|uniref:Uncharacterized protein n=1 Tax=Mycena alexandri TaxID=1745969 RepID=A0AAD6XB78_9AGAR|nr:hypothetical protein C8F04DRAFT_1321498 [Mycena alexandri]